jgi:hypothetical protein
MWHQNGYHNVTLMIACQGHDGPVSNQLSLR